MVSLLLSISSVQTKLGKVATNYLKNDFDVDINIDKVDLSFLGNVQLKNIYIKNHHSDTLIFAENLNTSIFSYRNIINNKLDFGKISLSNFILNIRTYEGEIDDALTVFVEKFDNETVVSTEPSGFLLTSSELALENGDVYIQDDNFPDDKVLFFKKIKGTGIDFKIDGPNVSVNLDKFQFVENHQIEVAELSTDFKYTKSYMKFLNTNLKTAHSNIDATINFNYDRDDFSDFNNKVKIDANVINADVSFIDLNKFYDEFGVNDNLHFSTTISGVLNDFITTNLDLVTDSNAIIKGDLNFKNAFNTENGFALDGKLNNLTSNYQNLKQILPNLLGKTLPSSFEMLGRFKIVGDTYITENLISAQLTMNTDLGTTITDLELTNISNIDHASYFGKVKIIDFELGKIMNDSLVGLLSMEAEVDGKGFTLETMDTSVKGLISKHQYKGYTYSNMAINGVVKSKRFDGDFEVNDDNVKLNFNGLADFSSEIYSFDFKTVVDYCDLNTINLFKRDSISNIRGDVDFQITGNTVDDLKGTINIKNLLYTNQKDNYFFKDFNITSSFLDSIRTITINSSEIIEGEVNGKFKFNQLGKLTQNSIGSIFSNYTPYAVEANQELDFRFRIFNKIIEVFNPEISVAANTLIRGEITSDDNLFRLNIKSPRINAYQNVINELNVQIDNNNPFFNTQLTIDKIESDIYNISDLHLVNITLNDTLYFRTEFKGGLENTETFDLSFYHTFNNNNKFVVGIQKSNVNFKNNNWIMNPEDNLSNNVIYDNKTDKTIINPFVVTSGKQNIQFLGEINDSTSTDLKFKFKDVQLANVTPKIDSLNLEGLINGSINYTKKKKLIKPTGNLVVSNFIINNSHQGDLKIDVEGNSTTAYNLDVSLLRDDLLSLNATGLIDFEPKKPTINATVTLNEFKLDAFSPLGEDVFTNIRGLAYGETTLTGVLENPTMTGDLFLDNAGIYIPFLNVDYNFLGTSVIGLNNQTFSFDDVTLSDNLKKTKANLTGTIKHKAFDNWLLDLSIETKNLLVLNTEEDESSQYFGIAFMEGLATIKGPTDELLISLEGKTKKGTHFVIPISDVKTADDTQTLRFVSKGSDGKVEEERRAFISENLKGLEMNFNMEITKDAVVEMVLDKATGSFLKGSGTGNLQINLDMKDKFEMYGGFNVDNGIYSFKYGGFINKPFIVTKGGNISWSGDPYTADIDIEAVYRVSANPRSLLENVSSSRKIPIDLVTRFSGELFNSQREFDIEIPNSSSTVSSELEFKLNDNDGNVKTRHFVSLLASGAFYNENDLSVNTSGLVYGTASDMLSNAFDNIFNQGNNKFKLRPVYTVGEKNSVDNVDTYDQFSIDVDYQISDRMLINGKLGVPIGSREQSTVIGEVTVEFLMNEVGTLRSSIFNRQNEIQYTEEEEGYTQGAGLSYQIDFDNGRELLEKLRLRKKKPVDTLATKTLVKTNDKIKFKKNNNE